MTQVIVTGACGRMGQAILRLAAEDPALEVVGCLETPACVANLGGELAVGKNKVPLVSDLNKLNPSPACVLIDFSAPEAMRQHLPVAAEAGVRLVVGTTGLTPEDRDALNRAAARTAVLVASNMSVGVNLLIRIVEEMSGVLADYDLEVVEMHHRHKKDAPSGTALSLAQAAAKGRGVNLGDVECHGRSGMTGERPVGQIGIHAVRGGDVVGEHTLTFAGPGERVEIVHRAHSRETFAAGALRAAKWLENRSAGMYSMRDVLGL